MGRVLFIFCLALVAAPLLAAETCPAPPDHRAEMDRLIAQAQTVGTVSDGRRITYLMWQLWADAPDDTAQELLDEGMSRREGFDFAGAVKAFDALIAHCPDYAEGYNQRAFINYLRQDYAAALPDLNRALERNPRHVAALSGKALVLMALNRDAEALAALRKALRLNPWLSERYLLPMLEKRVGESL